MKYISQGTISVLFGCHSPIHSILVCFAWWKVNKCWPKPWEIVCIFLHDIGHWGKQYLDDPEQKAEHWRLGARIADRLFGEEGYRLTAGHCSASPVISSMRYPDKYSWLIAPDWWLWTNTVVEPRLRMGFACRMDAVKRWQQDVQEWWDKRDIEHSLHEYYLKRVKENDGRNNYEKRY